MAASIEPVSMVAEGRRGPLRSSSRGIHAFRVTRRPTSILRRGFVGSTWLVAGALCFVLDGVESAGWPRQGALVLSALSALFGLWVFWRDGACRITAVGLYHLAFALFVGFSGLYQVARAWSDAAGASLFPALAICYFVQVTTWLLFWSGLGIPDLPPDAGQADGRTAGWAMRCGAVLLTLAVAGSTMIPGSVPLVNSAGFIGVLLLSAGLLGGPMRRWLPLGAVVIGVAFAIYFIYLFNGFGRLVLGALALALLVIAAHRDRRRLTKSLVLLGAAPVLLFLAGLRASDASASPGVEEDGFESAVSPLHSFAQLLDLHAMGSLPMAMGETFLNAAVGLIPRAIWPEKPVGFGADLVPFLSPELAGTAHSEAALWHGEWLFNFGLPGLALMIPVTGLVVRAIDWLLLRASSKPLDRPSAVGVYAGTILAAVGLFDLVWVGSFTYVVRTGGRLLVLLAVLLLLAWGASRLRTSGHAAESYSVAGSRRAGSHRAGGGARAERRSAMLQRSCSSGRFSGL
ncbi:hypothetical protein [Verrucosispora sioxanthis]|uniref:Uncharacterized protein n=1 Tax=Verrucosispora sioxanthis TaxID=2499994 RepID=A0A6M1KVQ3_9ACTN|nr:hypothetical protein [Verrucosispora sioxanthis]NEE62302.1 hypothetical protein [Verrucosispora sioxanthis]NGM11412.1 hypothetical protein [Verrucosispora sioxanthis]